MDFTTIGSINAYTKGLKMQTQWNLKKQSGDVTGHSSPMDEWLKSTSAPDSAEEEKDSKKLNTIMQKVYAGGKLTKEEKAYLQAKDPITYQKLQANEQEQKSYEQELKKCKTKEDVQRLKASRIGASLAAVKSIENNPHITQEKKLNLIRLENQRCEKLEASTQRFIKSGEYGKLPTEAEQAKAEKEQHEAEQAQRQPGVEQTEQRPGSEKAEQTDKEDQAARPVQSDATEKAAEAPKVKREVKSGIAEPESPEARKVRRAKAKAAYTATQGAALDDTAPAGAVNVQA